MVYEPLPGEELTRFLSDNVININFARTGISTWHPANYLLKNARGEDIGRVDRQHLGWLAARHLCSGSRNRCAVRAMAHG